MTEVEAAVAALLASDAKDFGPLADAYAAHGLTLPAVNFEPDETDILIEAQRQILRWWRDLAPSDDGLPEAKHIDPTVLQEHLGNLTVLAPDGAGDFVYRLHGSRISDAMGYELTGRRVSDGPRDGAIPAPIRTYFLTLYRIVEAQPKPLYARHPWRGTGGQDFHWHRVILPFGEGRRVTRLLVSNLATDGDKVLRPIDIQHLQPLQQRPPG